MKHIAIKSRFKTLVGAEDFTTLGQFFWDAFLESEGAERRVYEGLWNSLTKKQRKRLEKPVAK